MAKWVGKIGYAETIEKPANSGIWKEHIVERKYYGDVIRNNRKLQSSDNRNDDIVNNNELSIVSDPYAVQNFYAIRYAEFMGVKWKVTNVDVQYPRLTLTLGGIYNG